MKTLGDQSVVTAHSFLNLCQPSDSEHKSQESLHYFSLYIPSPNQTVGHI